MKLHPWLFLFLIFAGFGFVSCDPENVIPDNKKTDADTLDYVWDTTKVVTISLQSTGIKASDTKKVTVTGNIATINSKGTYELSGTLSQGQIVVNTDGIVRLIFNNVSISNATSSPVFVKNAKRTIIILPENSVNTITDGNAYTVTADSLNATIYSKDYLAIYGEGQLTVNANYNTGISSRDELVVQSGQLQIRSVGAGLRAKDYLKISDGEINITSGGDAIKAENDTVTKGFIEIYGGNFTLNSSSDGVSASDYLLINGGTFNVTTGGGSSVASGTESTKGLKGLNIAINGGEFTVNSSDNGIDGEKNITVDGGVFTLASASKAFDCDSVMGIKNGTVSITYAEKGISAHHVMISGGAVSVNSVNDCIKGTLGADLSTADGSAVAITGGSLLLATAKGDGLDSNGNITISGGTTVIQGSQTSSDDAVTYKSAFIISGGSLVASGGATAVPQAASTQKTVYIRFSTPLAASTVINIQDASGKSIISYKTAKYAYAVLVSLQALAAETYYVYTGGSVAGNEQNGYYNNGIYTPGTLRGSFTISNSITSVAF